MTDTTVTTDAPAQGNALEARTGTGELKDQSPSGTPSPQTKETPTEDEGQSFLTQREKPEAKPEPKPEDKPAEAKPAEGAPEKYADFTLPEGYTLTEEATKEIGTLFKELNLTQTSAQKLVDYYGKNLLQVSEAPYRQWADLQKEWVTDIHDRFGSKAESVRREINSAITNALPPSLARAFRTALDVTGAGSNPDVFEALSLLAKPHLEGKSVPQGKVTAEANKPPGQPERPSLAEAIYGHLMPNRGQQ